MPVNPGFEYVVAEERYHKARTPSEKLSCLIEMLRTVPKHKGTEKIRAEFTHKIALLRREIEKQKEVQSKRGSGATIAVKKEGIGQVVLVGMPNSGKSTLLNMLTDAKAEVAPYPFTTKKPEVGMLDYKGAKIQLVEVPALIEGSSEGKASGAQALSIIRNADAIIFVLSSAENADAELKILQNELEKANIKANKSRPNIKIRQSEFKGITISGKKFLKIKEGELSDFLKGIGIHNASIVLNEPTTIDRIAEVLDDRIIYKRALNIIIEKDAKNIDELKRSIFALLNKILIYTKKPGVQADLNEPLIASKGASIEEIAKTLHKGLAQKFKYAKVWGSTKFPGQRVSRNYRPRDFDIIEIYG